MTAPDPRILAAQKLLASISTQFSPKWTPGPHQVPPDGNWYGWLLLAGRGAGKTDACAHYIAEHVAGPPCLPGPVPHWIGIIAPTLGDAATSCYAGPSGLRAHSPDAKLVNRPGGLSVIWPNGSEAKLFGAHTPEDVERLRSGGNRCLEEGTLVRTEHGQVPIQDVRPGDRVWTRNGLRRVLSVWNNGVREVQAYQHAAGVTWMTPDHEVFTAQGWKQAQSVMTDDTVFTWLSSSSTTACGGTRASAIRTTGTAATGCSTGTCTPGRSDPYRPGCRCTTRTTTSGTTGRTTSSCSRPGSTGLSTARNAGLTGTPWEDLPLAPSASGRTSPASAAAPASGAGRTRGSRSVTAPTPAGTLRHGHGNNGCAACAARSTASSHVTRPALVRASALRTWSPGSSGRRRARVYDLTVEHDHEFFADGLLVSNCTNWYEELAAWRYLDEAWAHARFGLRVGPRPHWVASTTPKPRKLIIRLNDGDIANVAVSRGSMYDNPHLPDDIKAALEEEYGNTALGRQELYGEIIDQDENALWTQETIDQGRWLDDLPKLARITVGVDPSGGRDEQGIVVGGRAMLKDDHGTLRAHGFVLADRTVRLKPDGWGRAAVRAATEFDADDIVVERNFGGDMAVATIRSAADSMGVSIPIRQVTASRGKRVRAEPVAALSSQGRWHHAGRFPQLENQMTTWTDDAGWSPDRLDASVWTGWHNKVVRIAPSGGKTGLSVMASRTIG